VQCGLRLIVGALLCFAASLEFAFALGRAQDVDQDGHGQQSIQGKGNDGAQNAALRAGRFRDRHHHSDVKPSNHNQIHG